MSKTKGLTSVPRSKAEVKTNSMATRVINALSVKALDTLKQNVIPL